MLSSPSGFSCCRYPFEKEVQYLFLVTKERNFSELYVISADVFKNVSRVPFKLHNSR